VHDELDRPEGVCSSVRAHPVPNLRGEDTERVRQVYMSDVSQAHQRARHCQQRSACKGSYESVCGVARAGVCGVARAGACGGACGARAGDQQEVEAESRQAGERSRSAAPQEHSQDLS
jgi:hypothetical protein